MMFKELVTIFIIGVLSFVVLAMTACEGHRPNPGDQYKDYRIESHAVAQFWWKGHDCHVVQVVGSPKGETSQSYVTTLISFVECDGNVANDFKP